MTAPPRTPTSSRALNASLWSAQVALAAVFAWAAYLKLATPLAEYAQMAPWAARAPEALVRLVGIAELAGALGVIAPAAARILPSLTPLAAAGLGLVMASAVVVQVSLGLSPMPAPVFGALAAFVAWGRWRGAPILPRGAR